MLKSNHNIFYLLQVVIGWEYFVSGCNKVISKDFPIS